jgi:MFS family permease
MERLGDAYGARWEGRDPRRVLAGAISIALGALAVLAGVLVLTTPLGELLGVAESQATRRLAGQLAGLGVPLALVGVVSVLPSSRRERVGVLGAAAVCALGVGLFSHAYPAHWASGASPFAFLTAITYFAGGCLALWFVFTAVAEFRTRNNPHGPVRLELRRQGETKTVHLSPGEYRHYRDAVASDGGESEQVIRELESRAEE